MILKNRVAGIAALAVAMLLIGYSARAGDSGGTSPGPVQRFGRLQVKAGQLCSQSGDPVQLRGVSSHDLKSFPFAQNTVSNLVRDWHVSLVRAAMYTDSYGSSYIREPQVKQTVKLIVDEAIRNGIYVIVAWHILQDGNPNQYKEPANAFFEEVARAYGDRPNVIYEICNEPNGAGVTWSQIKAYAEFVIPAIRAIDPDNVIIVGTDTWCQGVRAAAGAPLNFTNILYALHFYAGTHRDDLRASADFALAKGLPLFVSEWGLTDYTGRGALYPQEARIWLDWMNRHKISWAAWSLSNANEGSAALAPAANLNGPWTDADLSPCGKWLRRQLLAQ